MLRPTPSVALIPLAIVSLGGGPDTKIALAVYGAVWPILVKLTDEVTNDIQPSVGRILLGWLVAVVLGTTAGTVPGRARTGTDYVGSLFAFFRAIPLPAPIPVSMVLFGIGTGVKPAVIVLARSGRSCSTPSTGCEVWIRSRQTPPGYFASRNIRGSRW